MSDVLIGSILSAMSTALGAVPIIFMKKFAQKWNGFLLAITSGIMVSATMFSLIPTALEQGSLMSVTVGLTLGVATLAIMEKTLPTINLDIRKNLANDRLFIILMALTLHNIPEGLSVGVSYAGGENGIGPFVAIAIGVQNFPEGFLVALFLVQQNISKGKAIALAAATGSVEIIAGIIGFALSVQINNLVPYGLAFAAGAMLFIVYKELIPESYEHDNSMNATFGFVGGLLAMVYVSHIFG